jgi:tetratricopeptide (TPR) repeat protein
MRHRTLFVQAILIAVAMGSSAQSIAVNARGGCAIWGQIVAPGRSLEAPIDIELVTADHRPSQKTRAINGNFGFAAVPPGRYLFRVLDESGQEIYGHTRVLKGTADHVIIQVAQLRSEPSTLSLSELKRKTNPKAQNEVSAAEKSLRDGRFEESANHLVKAVEIDPYNPEALTILVATYLDMDRMDEALQQAQRAFETNPAFPASTFQYAVLLMVTKNYEKCEAVARSLIRNQDYVAEAKSMLAVSLIGQGRNFTEALALVQQAALEFPLSRLWAADALVEARQPNEAVKQVREYLNSSANPCERAQLENWIAAANAHSSGD